MRIRRSLLTAAFAVSATGAAQSQPTITESMIGIGPHGYDWSVGTWSCINRMPSKKADPNTRSLLTTSKTGVDGALLNRETAKGFDSSAYSAYVQKTKTWWNPVAFADRSYQIESTTDTGKKAVRRGSYFNAASGTTTKIRDTFTVWLPAKFTDEGEAMLGNGWKTTYFITCTRP